MRGRRVGAVLAIWVVLFGLFGWLAGRIGDVQDNDETNWMPANAGSTRAVTVERAAFPGGDGAPLVAVYVRDDGLTPADLAAVDRDRAGLAAIGDGPVAGPAESADRRAVTLTVPVNRSRLDSGEVDAVVARARALVADGLPAGLTVQVTGAAASRADAAAANGQADGALTLAAAGVVVLVLLFTYRSPLLPLVPLACVGVAVAVAQGGVYLAGRAGAVVSGSSFILMIVLVFGLGTDYALLLISRYREELRAEPDRYAAMARALRRTAPTVLAAAGTMGLASLALGAASMNSTRGLGPVAAVAVVAALAVMTTLLPALLVLLGRWIFWPRIPRPDPVPSAPSAPRKRRAVERRPRRTWVLTAALLLVASLGSVFLRLGGLAGGDNFTREPESVTGQRLLAGHFPAGAAAPALLYGAPADAVRLTAAARSTPGVAGAGPAELAPDGSWARIPVVLADPPTSTAAQRTVERLRSATGDPIVGGTAAALLDQNRAMNRDLLVLVPLISVLVALALGAMLRAVLAPLLLLGCALLSAAAALGLGTLVFHALGFPRTDPTVLTLGFVFLVALGVDYTIFLVLRARQDGGLARALDATGGVITSAALVLAATFLVLTITPVVLNIQLGLLVAIGVLLDAFVVRTVLVPAAAIDAGPRLWWPGRLSRESADRPGTRTPPAEPGPGRAASSSRGSGGSAPWPG
ncbi:MMPL family transporter [Actinoplanes subtropicus]|uniref:MMPL family transporter n=1 Tax=Actinoplanes subtropicus TaxID=543632 RepID=UPI0005560194|nr:MMPL family transporter [Actinoplanes subtropicus]